MLAAEYPLLAQPDPRIVSEACEVEHRSAQRNPNRSRRKVGTTSAEGFWVVATVTMPAARPRATKSRSRVEKAWAALRSGPLVK
jgi:hypothetical protein